MSYCCMSIPARMTDLEPRTCAARATVTCEGCERTYCGLHGGIALFAGFCDECRDKYRCEWCRMIDLSVVESDERLCVDCGVVFQQIELAESYEAYRAACAQATAIDQRAKGKRGTAMGVKLKTITSEREVTESLNCDSCKVNIPLVFDRPDGVTKQGKRALIVSFIGGYGMYIDPLGEPRDNYEFMLCKECADKLLASMPCFGRVLQIAKRGTA